MKNHDETSAPLARRENVIVQELPDELLVYDLKTHKVHCLNQTAAMIWNECDGRSTVAQIAGSLANKSKTQANEDLVLLALSQLTEARLLAEEPITNSLKSISRRELIRRAGVATTIALPIVTSIVAPTAAQAATCRSSGSPCSTSAQCCNPPGTCDNGICL